MPSYKPVIVLPIVHIQHMTFMPHLRNVVFSLFLLGLSACSALSQRLSTPTTLPPPPPTATSSLTPSPTVAPSATPLTCLKQRGELTRRKLQTTTPHQEFLLYLPPCYDQRPDLRYPVLYLLHGQTYTDDQWVSLGATVAADNLIHSGEAAPFILVFPDDRYWNLAAGGEFDDRLINNLIPTIDKSFRTLADREHRALGGLSRGGGWGIHMLLTQQDLFGTIGLHSPVIFEGDAYVMQKRIKELPAESWPRLWIDAGDRDGELGKIRHFETMLALRQVPHDWRMYVGDHTDAYWQAHVVEYLQWYVDGFGMEDAQPGTATPAP